MLEAMLGLELRSDPPTELLEAIQTFPNRWSRLSIAAAQGLRGDRSVWAWCDALDDIDRALRKVLPPESETRIKS